MMKTHLSRIWRAALLLCALLALGTTQSAADPRQWGADGIIIRQGHHIEWQRASYRNSDGYVLTVWSDTRVGDRDVYGQLVSPSGQQLWESTGKPIVRYPYRQEDPDVVAVDGGWVVAWIDFRNDSTGDVWAQKITNTGEFLWVTAVGDSGVLVDELPFSPVNELSVRVVHDGAGGAIIAWEDQRRDPGDIYAQHMTSSGTRAWASPLAITDLDGDQIGITADGDGAGNMLVAWNDKRNLSDQNIYAAKITPSGSTPWGANGLLVCGRAGEQGSTKICTDNQGGCYLGWQDRSEGSSNNLYVQHLNGSGQLYSASWEQDGIVLCNAQEDQKDLRVAPSMNGSTPDGLLTVWEDQRVDGYTFEVYGQKVSPTGQMLWASNGLIICGDADTLGTGHSRNGARLTTDLAGGLVCCWEDTRTDEKGDLWVARVNAGGVMVWGECGLEVVTAPGEQFAPVLRADDSDGIFVFWSDRRLGSQSLRYQNLAVSSGSKTLSPDGVEIVYGLDGDAVVPRAIDMTMGRVGIVWSDNRLGSGGPLLYYQVVDTHGYIEREMNGGPIAPKNLSANQANQKKHQLCTDGNAGFFVSFEDQRSSATLIRLSHVNMFGVMDVDSEGVVVAQSSSDQADAFVAYDGAGGCYVAWSGNNADFWIDVYVMRMNASCQPLWTQPVRLTNSPDDDVLRGLVSNPDGCCIAVWKSGNFGQFDVSSARVCAEGSVTWNTLVCDAPGDQDNAAIVSDGQGGAYYAWSDNRDLNNSKDIFAQHLNAAGTESWTPNNGVVVITNPLLQDKPVLKLDMQNNLYVIWEDFRTGVHLDLYGQKLNSNGALQWPTAGKPICTVIGDQNEQAPLVEWGNGLYIVWTDGRGYFPDIYGTHFDQNGALTNSYWRPDSGGVVNDFYQVQSKPTVAHDGHGGLICAWQDQRASGKEPLVNIWAQWLNDLTVGVDELRNVPLPKQHELGQNYPNPFNPSTQIIFAIPQLEKVEVILFNALGQEVTKLVDEIKPAGTYRINFTSNRLASGVYFYQLRTPSFQQVKKMMILK
jgi:hypothetical protein